MAGLAGPAASIQDLQIPYLLSGGLWEFALGEGWKFGKDQAQERESLSGFLGGSPCLVVGGHLVKKSPPH